MTPEIIDAMRTLENFRFAKPASREDIEKAEKTLGLTFSEEYNTYLFLFGSVSARGVELNGLFPASKPAERLDVICQTQKARKQYPNLDKNLYVVADDDFLNCLIAQDVTGQLYKIHPNGKVKKYLQSFSTYILTLSVP